MKDHHQIPQKVQELSQFTLHVRFDSGDPGSRVQQPQLPPSFGSSPRDLRDLHRAKVMLRFALLAVLPLASRGYVGPFHGVGRSGVAAARGRSHPVPTMEVPTELSEAAWLPELQACCAVISEDGDGPQRMGAVLEWLQTMLINLELHEEGDEETEEDELDPDFVSAARPWLHTKAFFDIPAQGFASTLWGHVSGAAYLQPGGEGGSLLLLLPSRLPLSLFEQVGGITHHHEHE